MRFADGCDALSERVGFGLLEGKVMVNQVYAAAMERGSWVEGPLAGHANHPLHGGEQHYLEHSMTDNAPVLLANLAEHALEQDGLYAAMVDDMELVAAEVGIRAPVEFGNLRDSGHPQVIDNGAVVYDRPPASPRLSTDEIAAQNRMAPDSAEWREWSARRRG